MENVQFRNSEFVFLCATDRSVWRRAYGIQKVPEGRPYKTPHWHVRAPNTHAVREHIRLNFRRAELSAEALQALDAVPLPNDIVPGTFPFKPEGLLYYQQEALDKAYGKHAFFFAHEMGSGKSRTALELAAQYFREGSITELWILPPNDLIGNWREQIKLWTPILEPVTEIHGLLSLQSGKLPETLINRAHDKLMVAVDESQYIKNFKAVRTENVVEIGDRAGYKVCLTGTQITKGVADIYSQYRFLDKNILGHKTYYGFRNRYCVMGGYEGKEIIGVQRLEELTAIIAPYTHIVVDPIKLPPQTPETREVELTLEQRRLLRELKNEMLTELNGQQLSITNVISYMTRGMQIIGGFFPSMMGEEPLPLASNPKMAALRDIVALNDCKIVVFSNFKAEAKMIQRELAQYGFLRLDPDIEPVQDTVNRLQNDPNCRGLVCTYKRGSRGFTMTAAKIIARYSGTFNYEELVQSAKRNHRLGQEFETKLIDIRARSPLDRRVASIAQTKQDLAETVTDLLMNPQKLAELFT